MANRCVDLFTKPKTSLTTLQKAAFWLTLTSGTLAPLATMAGGFSGTGGGGGIASFANPKDAQRARELIKEGKELPPDLLANAKIQTLEGWEMQKWGLEPIEASPGASWQIYLAKAKENLRAVSPIIASKLDLVKDWMSFSDWQGVENLPSYKDANPSHNATELQVPIQLALRLSDGNSSGQKGPVLGKVRLKVIFNMQLFERLSPLEQAMLVLHEEFYALGQAIGHESSDHVRPLVTLFFSKYGEELARDSEGGVIPVGIIPGIKKRLTAHFGDYVMFFSELAPRKPSAPRTAERHSAVFLEVVLELREQMIRCRGTGMSPQACAQQIHDAFGRRDDVSPEKAFMYLSYFFLEKHKGALNAEALMDTTKTDAELKEVLDKACKLMIAGASTMLPEIILIRPALVYCL